MKKRFFKRVASIAIALTLMLGLFAVSEINAYAEEEHPTGLKELEVEIKDVSEEEFNELTDESQKADAETFVEKYYKGKDAFWTQFSSPYYNYSFSRLNANQRTLYNDLYNKLFPLIDGGADFAYYNDGGCYLTPIVTYSGLSNDEALNVAYLLLYNTPELYYLSEFVGVFHDVSSGKNAIRIGVYDEMHTGAQRANYASLIKSKINWYLGQVSTSASAYDKEKTIHDLLINNCAYDHGHLYPYSQSCASVFLNPNGYTVCAGYSEAFALLCYARGIPAMSITSAGHEWNQVKLGNYWYAVDVTWDDSGSSRYKHFNKSDNTMLALGRADHTLEGFWSSVGRESCPYDYGSEPSPIPTRGVTSGIYVGSHTYNNISAGLAIEGTSYNNLEYFWMAYDVGANTWYTISDWNGSTNWVSWNPTKAGAFWLLGKARWATTKEEATSTCIGIMHSGKEIFPNVSSGVYIPNETYNNVQAGLAISGASVSDLDYMWMAYDVKNNSWSVISDWTRGNNWVNWNPGKTGWFWLLGRARWTGTSVEATSTCVALNHKQCISGKCITPNPGWAPGWLVGLSTFDNPNNSYRYEVQILDCTRLLLGDPNPWVYSTGPMNIGGANTAWTSWQPYPGNYWTLFRIYDAYGNILDEECYGFVA